jgi:hypothetical protein
MAPRLVFAMHAAPCRAAHHPNEVINDETIGLDGAIEIAPE